MMLTWMDDPSMYPLLDKCGDFNMPRNIYVAEKCSILLAGYLIFIFDSIVCQTLLLSSAYQNFEYNSNNYLLYVMPRPILAGNQINLSSILQR